PDENTILFEALARRGYVVAVVLATGADEPNVTLDAKGLETQTRDLELALSSVILSAAEDPYRAGAPRESTDPSASSRLRMTPGTTSAPIVAVGFSFGGAAAIYAAMRNPNITAVVALDSSAIAKRFVPTITGMPFFAPERFTVPLLDVHRADPATVTDEVIERLRYSDRTSVELTDLNHIDFTSFAQLYGASAPADTQRRAAAYRDVIEHVVRFVEGKRELAWQGASVRRRAAILPPPDLAQVIKSEGVAAARKAYDETRRRDPLAQGVSEDAINRLGAMLLSAGDKEAAKEVWSWNVLSYPRSANALDSLAEALMALGDEACSVVAYRRVLALVDTQTDRALAELLRRIATEALAKLPRDPAPCALPALQ
ncbi:MAG TPA: hypothetical protein VF698_03375, partial [Thermoanaerobaculia bacterium]